jgi:hypothetical protein
VCQAQVDNGVVCNEYIVAYNILECRKVMWHSGVVFDSAECTQRSTCAECVKLAAAKHQCGNSWMPCMPILLRLFRNEGQQSSWHQVVQLGREKEYSLERHICMQSRTSAIYAIRVRKLGAMLRHASIQ